MRLVTVAVCWDNADMSGNDKFEITPPVLADAAGKAAATQAGSVVSGIVAPPPTATSQMDGALVLMGTTGEAARQVQDTTDSGWAVKQAAALAESPPNLVAQDEQNAQTYPPQVVSI